MAERCDLCFKVKTPLQAPIKGLPAKTCKGCFYDIDRIVGFLEHYGFTVTGQSALPFKPPKPPKPKTRATKKESGDNPPDVS